MPSTRLCSSAAKRNVTIIRSICNDYSTAIRNRKELCILKLKGNNMNKEYYIKGNKLIDNFMGVVVKLADSSLDYPVYVKVDKDYEYSDYFESEDDAHYKSNYHYGYNELISVLEKIESYGCIVEIWMSLGRGCRICKPVGDNGKVTEFKTEANDTKEAIYTTILEYIEWFNKRK